MRLFLLLLLFCLPPAVWAQPEPKERETVIVPPPLVLPMEVEIRRGESVRILLQAKPTREPQIRIRLRSLPKLGTLETEAGADSDGLTVVYTHDGTTQAVEDSFQYAAQSKNSGVSSPATVRIRIVEAPPRLEAPAALDFGAVFSGSRAERVLRLRNSGGGVLTGRFTVPSPWQALDGTEFAIPEGGQQELRLAFIPHGVAEYNGVLTFSDNLGPSVAVRASVPAPFTMDPEDLETALLGTQRTVVLRVKNMLPSPAELETKPTEGIEVTGPKIMQPGEISKIEIRNAAAVAVAGTVMLSAGEHSESIHVRLAPLPAQVTVHPEGVLRFTASRPGAPVQQTLDLRNTGGEPATYRVVLPSPFVLQEPANEIVVQPGGSVRLTLMAEGPSGGVKRAEMLLSGSSGSLQVPLQLDLVSGASPATTASAAPPPGRRAASRPADSSPGVTRLPQRRALAASTVPPLEILEKKHHSLHLGWTRAKNARGPVTLEIRQFKPGPDGKLMTGWGPWTDALISESGSRIEITVPGVQSGRSYMVRARAGEVVSADVLVETRIEAPRAPPWGWLFMGAVLLLLGSAGWRAYRRVMPVGQ